jgi:D-aminopeptidase
MRFLADAGMTPKIVEYLRALGHDAVHVRELALQRADDRTIIARAIARGVYEASALPFPDALPSWKDRFGRH